MQSWKLREQVLDIFEETTGGRVIFSVCDIGGVRKDISPETLMKIKTVLTEMEKELRDNQCLYQRYHSEAAHQRRGSPDKTDGI